MTQAESKQMLKKIEKAQALLDKDKLGEAHAIFNELVGSEIEDSNVLLKLGYLAFRVGNNLLAITFLSKAKDSLSDNSELLYWLAFAYFRIGRHGISKQVLLEAIELNSNRGDYYYLLSQLTVGELKKIELLEKAIELKASNTLPYIEIIRLLSCERRQEEALAYAKKLVQVEPNAINNSIMSRVLVELGEIEEACDLLEKTIALYEYEAGPYHELSQIKTFTSDDEAIIKKAKHALGNFNHQSVNNQSLLYFALGKIHDDLKLWDQAFEYYRQGNVLRKPAAEPDHVYKTFKARKKLYYNKDFLRRAEELGSDSEKPVFVVGMPRSGTTLIEKIIASHPDAGGAGELEEIMTIDDALRRKLNESDGDVKKIITKEEIGKQAEFYLDLLRKKGSKDARRIVDKMPNNYFVLGLVHMLFPNARIIHAVRNPLDTCLSNYFQPFDVLKESCDLVWLGRRYRFYREIMSRWKKLLPQDRIIEVRYEDLTSDPATQSRRLIEACGLPWDEQCLNYHKSSHTVITASIWQARQPIYTTSKKRWVNYASHLGDLVREISDYLDQDDIDELKKHGIKVRKKLGLGFLSASK